MVKVVMFRFVDANDRTPTGHRGIAYARDKAELFQTIDQFGNPFDVQIATPRCGGICVEVSENEDGEVSAQGPKEAEFTDEWLARLKWRDPKWPDNYYTRWVKATERQAQINAEQNRASERKH